MMADNNRFGQDKINQDSTIYKEFIKKTLQKL